ncbi:MAG: hypothetical protein ACK40V_10075, partial [Anaerolineales bacterium]
MNNEDNDRLRRLLKSEEETRKDIEPPQTSGTTAAKKTGGTTPRLNLPDVDKDGMPLPKRVEEVDMDGTRVTPAAYRQNPPQSGQQNQRPVYRLPENQQPQQPRYTYPPQPQNIYRSSNQSWFSTLSSFFRNNKKTFRYGCITSVFAIALIGLCIASFFVYQYASIASTLPPVDDLKNRASQFETTRILDRNGQPLYDLLDPTAGRRTYIPL